MDFVFERLSELHEPGLIWKNVDWALGIDQEKAVNIFIRQIDSPNGKLYFKYDDILDYLNKYDVAKIAYLEHLIFVKRIEVNPDHRIIAPKSKRGFRLDFVQMMSNPKRRQMQLQKANENTFFKNVWFVLAVFWLRVKI